MTKQLISAIIFSAITLAGCGTSGTAQHEPTAASGGSQRSDEEIAAQTLSQMLEVAEKGDWGTYVDQFYGEQHKFGSPADRDALVQRFQEKWGQRVLSGLHRASKLPIQLEGDMALFLDGEDSVFTLHRSNEGEWKFHL